VITSRSRPKWAAPKLAIYGEAIEIGANELTMTSEEATEVLGHSKRTHPIAAIGVARGWPAIIGLAAHTETEDLPDEIPARLYEFLAEDLVGSAPPEVQEALAVLAIAGVGDIATAQELLGRDSSSAIAEAERRGLLTFSGTRRLTLHPLLSDFLIARLHRDTQKLSILVDRIVPHLVASQRWDECLVVAEAVPPDLFPLDHVLESALEELLGEGRVATVSRWAQLARTARLDAPIVDLAEGEVALRAGDYERALALGSRAATGASAEPRTRAQLLAARAAHLAERRATAAEWFGRVEVTASSNDMRTAALWGLFMVQFEEESGNLQDALSRFMAATDGSVEHQLRCTQGRFFLALAERKIMDALDASVGGMALLSLPAEALPRLATLNQRAFALGWAGRYSDALAVSNRALAEAETACIDFAVTHIQVAKAAALVGLRKFAAAQQLLATVSHRLHEEPDRWVIANLPLPQAKLQISLGDLARAEKCLTVPPDSRQFASQRAEYYGYRGLIAAARGLADDAEEWARRSAECSTYVEAAAFAAVTRAIIGARSGTGSPTVPEQFKRALDTGHHDSIVTACRACPELVAQIAQTDHRDTLAAILSESRDTAIARPAGLRLLRPPHQADVRARHTDVLSPRELEIYELIVQGRTNREISQILFIAESTTKVHVRHILEKLGVRSRVEAVRAWQLDDD
jgi:ATP/maltotriose-dependent transcriptional regulator MalT